MSIYQIRNHDEGLILRGGRLFQQYLVDNFVKIENQRLKWLRHNQATIRAEFYQGLQDSLAIGENDASLLI